MKNRTLPNGHEFWKNQKFNNPDRINAPMVFFLLNQLKPRRGQTAIEYVMMISATVVFITLVAYFVKNKVIAP